MMLSRLSCFIFLAVASLSASQGKDVGQEYLALRQQIGRGNYAEALTECKRLIRAHPDFAIFYETLPEVAAYSGRSSEAVEFFYERIEDGTQLPLVYYGLGTAYYLAKDFSGAVACFGYAVESGCDLADCYRAYEYAYEKLAGADAAIGYFGALSRKNTANSNALYAMGLAFWSKQDYERGLECMSWALRIQPDNKRFLQARVALMIFLGRNRDVAKEADSLRLRCWRDFDFVGLAFLDSYVVLNLFQKDNYSKAKLISEEILTIGSKFGFVRWEGWGHKRMADIDFFESNFPDALSEVESALRAIKIIDDSELEAAILNRKFEILDELGLLYDALDVAYAKYEVARTAGLRKDEALGLCDIATALDDLGSPNVALEYAIAAFDKAEALGSGNAIRYKAHNVLGTVYEGLGQNEDALSNFSKALMLLPRDNFSFRAGIMLECRIGRALVAQKEFAKAGEVLLRQQKLCKRYGYEREESYATAHLGLLAFRLGDNRLAKTLLNSAYSNGVRLGQLSTMAVASRGLSSLAERSGQIALALEWQEKVLSAEEAMGLRRDPLSSVNVTNIDLARDYDNCIRLNTVLGNYFNAFKWAGKRRSHSMNTIMATPVPQIDSLSDEGMRDKVSTLRSEVLRLHNVISNNSNRTTFGIKYGNYLSNITELNRLEMRYQAIVDSQELFASKRLNGPASLEQLMSRLRSEKSSLVEVCVGDADLFEFVVTPDTFFCLTFHVSSDSITKLLRLASPLFEESRRGRSVPNPIVANIDQRTLQKLYDLLIRSIRPTVDPWSGLIFITDDLLKNLPFDILPTGESKIPEQGRSPRSEFLLDKFEISYSLSTDDILYAREENHSNLLPIVGFGNPISAISRPYQVPAPLRIPKQSLLWIARRNHPGVLDEMKHIQSIFQGQATVLIGSQGSASTFLSVGSRYRILHVAAHVVTSEGLPLSSGICLSDGKSDTSLTSVTVADILGLHLNCDLAVMSGCNTGRTERNAGGGNLSVAMLRAGARSVVSSLWEVDDAQTAEFMNQFYRLIRGGETKVSALRKAKISLIEGGGRDPFYWGPFILIGDRSTILMTGLPIQRNDTPLFSSIIGLLILAGALVEWWEYKARSNMRSRSS